MRETETEAPKRHCKDGTGIVFKEPSQAQKKTPQEHQDLELQSQQPSKGQLQKHQEESPRQLKPLECAEGPLEQAVTERKPAEGCKGRKRPYSILGDKEQSPPREKCGRLLQLHQCDQEVRSNPPRPHPILSNSVRIKGGVLEYTHGSETTDKRERRCVTEEKSLIQRKGRVNLARRKGDSMEPGLPGTSAQISGPGDSLLPNKMAVLEAEETPLTHQERAGGVDQIIDITQEMEKEIKTALGPGPQEEHLSSRFKLQITRRDIQTLENGQWLNDEVINFYMNLLVERNENRGYPALHVFSTFFYPKLKHSGYSSVKRWTRGINLFEKQLILVPIHQEIHWSLVVIDLRKQSIAYLDSMGQTGKSICETIFQYLQNESKTRRNIELDPLEWKQYSVTSEQIPLQLNGNDCGVFTCKYADYIARDQPVTFSQQHMPIFRKRMVWEILHCHLL